MIVYSILFIVIALISRKVVKDKFQFKDFIILAILILFSGMRQVGLDYKLYNTIYDSNFELTSRTGIGFTYLMYFFKYDLSLDFQWLIFFISFFTNLLIYYYIKKKSDNPGLSIILYVGLGFYTTSFNMFRQSLSIALVLFSSCFEWKNRKILKISCIIFAFVIHSSSLIASFLYTVFELLKKKKIPVCAALIIPLFGIAFYDNLFSYIIGSLDGYSMYLNYDSSPGIGTYMNVILYVLIGFILILPTIKKKIEKSNSHNYKLYNLLLIGLCIMLLEVKNFLFFRIAFYFTISIVILLADYYKERRFRYKKEYSLLFYVCIFIYFLTYVYSFDGVLPYKLFFIK